jgi:DNA-directed RNA polymerase specialized sigma24 family protein
MNCSPKGDLAMTHEEIAQRLGISRSAVVKAEQRALRKLRLSLEAIGEALQEREVSNGQAAAA